MDNESLSPDEQITLPTPPALVEPDSPALATDLEDSFFETRRFREGGWDGPGKALFIGTLAETGVVTFACRVCNMSAKSAYALRHRDPVFSKAWGAALDMARHRLADELLARSLRGSAEQLLRDGCIVGERHHYDNKLAFAICVVSTARPNLVPSSGRPLPRIFRPRRRPCRVNGRICWMRSANIGPTTLPCSSHPPNMNKVTVRVTTP